METELVENGKYEPLFETMKAKGRLVYRLFSASIFVGIVCVWIYRVIHIPEAGAYGRMGWIGVYGAELWFGIYWIFTQALRWNPVFRQPFRQTLLKRYGKALPRVDVFVCTADPATEPPMMVVNTVLSAMAYDYPPEKLSVYLSDDAGSELTFYALMEASNFSKQWIPYCKKFNIEPRSPGAYFSSTPDVSSGRDFSHVKKLYQEMENRIESACQLGRIPTNEYHKHTGFSKWDPSSSRKNHAAILQIVIDGREEEGKDSEGQSLPTLVYMAREKRPNYFHNFKAGALNALIRVSSEISNAPIILTLDCDMYSNDSGSVQDALCFFMDEEKSHNIAYVQYPQSFHNITKNELYGGCLRISYLVELHGMDGYGGPWYIGTGCFHRREALFGKEFSKVARNELLKSDDPPRRTYKNVDEFEESLEELVSCTYEENTQWGREIGMKYGCLVEDVLTGFSILCNGWKSVYFSPARKAFLGSTGTTLDQVLLQQKRWSEGGFQTLFTKYSPVRHVLGKFNIGLTLSYLPYCLWAPHCFPVLCYSIIPSLYLLKGVPLFPQVSSVWFLPFAYVLATTLAYSCAEFLYTGGTLLGWWNEQRMWLYKRLGAYLLAFLDITLKLVGCSSSTFVISAKVSDEDVCVRYEQEMMEFGSDSPMFTILSSVAMLNAFCFVWAVKKMVTERLFVVFENVGLQIVLCGVLVLINLPIYNAMFFRKDKGRMPNTVTYKAIVVALSASTFFTFL
ncbi:PREDICTED: cellulose synthase-like protein E1 [Ipomoea nil]|uniref:cellulose synthase-like protein E1 n=1 Tax=Ipomoea nil TaxID=35883 RepID=UPI000900D0E5|nr:PREDICTED: cellulose synthase-like protein E1 [Ipomoea nil]